MTRQQFFAARAQADFVKRHGVTVCPPAAAEGAELQRPHRSAHRTGNVLRGGVPGRIVAHVHDEGGAAIPMRLRRFHGAD